MREGTDHLFTEADVVAMLKLAHETRDILWTLNGELNMQTLQLRQAFGLPHRPPPPIPGAGHS